MRGRRRFALLMSPPDFAGARSYNPQGSHSPLLNRSFTPPIRNPSNPTVMVNNSNKLKVFSGRANIAAERAHRPLPRRQPRQDQAGQLPRRRNLGPHRRGRARPRHLHRPADLPAGQQEPDGAAHHPRRVQAGQRRAHHRRAAVLRLRPPGPQGPGPRADHRQAGGRPADLGRRRPRAGPRPARRPDPGLLRHPRRSPLCRPRHQRIRPRAEHPAARLRGAQSRRGQHQEGADVPEEARRRDRHRGQAPLQRHADRAGQPDRRLAGGQGGGRSSTT